jgi:polyprenyl P-hydroxybenzoate/phenylacrylic acid decarboxylase-like protein
MQTKVKFLSSKRLIVGISGTSGVILGIRLLEELKKLKVETHLIVTETAEKIICYETKYAVKDVKRLADFYYDNKNFFSKVASGSFKTSGMTIIPCSMKTLAGIANGYTDNLLLRTADVCLKERRRTVLVVRETPLSLIHLNNMKTVTQAGGIIMPANLSFYSKPKNIDQMVDHIVGKVLDLFDINNNIYKRWDG